MMNPGMSLIRNTSGILFIFYTLCFAQSSVKNERAHFPTYFHLAKLSENRCPASCSDAGPTSFSWSRVFSLDELDKCDDTVVFETMLRFPVDSPDRQTLLKACTASTSDLRFDPGVYGEPALSGADVVKSTVDVEVGWNDRTPSTPQSVNQVIEAVRRLQALVTRDPNNRLRATFAKSGKAVVGLYAGGEIHRSSSIALLGDYIDRMSSGDAALGARPSRQITQICGPTGSRSATHVFGLVSDTEGDLNVVHDIVKGWADGDCVDRLEHGDILRNQSISLISAVPLTPESTIGGGLNSSSSMASNSSVIVRSHPRRFLNQQEVQKPHQQTRRDGTCRVAKVGFGDSCWSIAEEKCGISLSALYEYNNIDATYCGNMVAGDELCCSEGNATAGLTSKSLLPGLLATDLE